MITVRKSEDRGLVNIGWLESRHSFSFGQYMDPRYMGFGTLRVINDDIVAPSGGFPPHPHKDMEIITYVLSGALAHKDSLGNGSIIRAGDIQRMSAGTGITHSEFNSSDNEPVHLLQIWIIPEEKDIAPGYEQHAIDRDAMQNRWLVIASDDGRDGSVTIHQHVTLYATLLKKEKDLPFQADPAKKYWLHVAKGSILINGLPLHSGDAVALSDEAAITLRGMSDDAAEILLFEGL